MIKDKNRGESLDPVGMNLCKCVFCGKYSNRGQDWTIDRIVGYSDNKHNNAQEAIDNDGNVK